MKKIGMMLLTVLILAACGRQDTPVSETTVAVTEMTLPVTTVMETTQPETEPTEPETIPTMPPEPESDEIFVRVLDYIPTASQELMYATEQNFTGQVIYDFTDSYLRWGTVKKLRLVSEDLAQMGL